MSAGVRELQESGVRGNTMRFVRGSVEHRQHMAPPAPTRSGIERAGSLEATYGGRVNEIADRYESPAPSRQDSGRRHAHRRTAFLDSLELTEPRHRVAGWNWDDHLNGFVAAQQAREFTCSCGENVPAPGYTDCRCGKRWNVYEIHSSDGHRCIAREVPVRNDVVMAQRNASRRARGYLD